MPFSLLEFFMKDICVYSYVYSYVANFFAQMDKDIIKIERAEENSEDING